ncbi:MAG: hypothetical protein C5S47_07035 [Candidatus Methanogasteraceae archaeon]|nr:MAG: hypothetical protein C5S47_07035 [ANME-2 cluster archaeon]
MERGDGRQDFGLVRACRCPNCGYTKPYQPGKPCFSQACPRCGTVMVGE